MFEDFDFTDFWNDADYSVENYQDQAPESLTARSLRSESGPN